ncbi:MAG: ABC transporter ATP-binding protein, partial [Chloroflexi bacterium]|nr:ABC transporter ATP-binding protein [Chloroflexota bacterium]
MLSKVRELPSELDGAGASEQAFAVEARSVWKRYRRYAHRNLSLKGQVIDLLNGRRNRYVEFDALRDVSFDVPHGQMLAIVGRNGAGKSTLLRILAGVVEPDAGKVEARGRVSPLLELGAGFAYELSGRRNIYLYGALLGLSRREITEQLDSIIEFSEIGDFMDTPIKHYSTGMYVRLAFAVAAHLKPDVLLLDEVLAVGDAAFQAKCRARIEEFRRAGKTIILVTHALPDVIQMCDRALLLEHGVILDDGRPDDVLATYSQVLAQTP